MVQRDLAAAFGRHLRIAQICVHLWGDAGDGALDDGACKESAIRVSLLLSIAGLCMELRTSLELDRHRLICAFHQKPTMPVSQALLVAFAKFVQHEPEACKLVGVSPDELHIGERAMVALGSETRVGVLEWMRVSSCCGRPVARKFWWCCSGEEFTFSFATSSGKAPNFIWHGHVLRFCLRESLSEVAELMLCGRKRSSSNGK